MRCYAVVPRPPAPDSPARYSHSLFATRQSLAQLRNFSTKYGLPPIRDISPNRLMRGGELHFAINSAAIGTYCLRARFSTISPSQHQRTLHPN